MFSFTDCEFLRPRILFPHLKKVSFFQHQFKPNQRKGARMKIAQIWTILSLVFQGGTKIKKPSGFCSRHFLKKFQAIYCHKYEIEITHSRFMRKRKEFRAKSWKFVWPAYQISSQDLDEECRFWSGRRSPTFNSPGSLHFAPALPSHHGLWTPHKIFFYNIPNALADFGRSAK